MSTRKRRIVPPDRTGLSRRDLLKAGMGVGAGTVALSAGANQLLERAASASVPRSASLSDIEHVVILMQENRSFDHYYGTMSDVRGFSDTATYRSYWNGPTSTAPDVLRQKGYAPGIGPDKNGTLEPFHLRSKPPSVNGQTTNDITHDWGPQHVSWNNGAMDQFVMAHLAADGNATPLGSSTEVPNGILTMGYLMREDIAFYHALADAFTICDNYFCSVIGPTDPNRTMQMTASVGADGENGPPVLETYVTNRLQQYGTRSWTTVPERLSEAGVSWKVYQDPTSTFFFNILPYFKQYVDPLFPGQLELAARGLAPVYPAEFLADIETGNLPSVSWILPTLPCCEHPATPPAYGEWLTSQVLAALVSNPEVWERTVLFVIYDENGGWFDHVSPPTSGAMVTSAKEIPTSDDFLGEYVLGTPSDDSGILGPVGLGFRVPCLVVSPFSRGGYVSSELFDHTSILQFIEKRFGADLPNLSNWRRARTGDMVKALPLLNAPDPSVPTLPTTSLLYPEVAEQAVINSLLGFEDLGLGYPPPTSNSLPSQVSSPTRIPI
jgi:phospholipase C